MQNVICFMLCCTILFPASLLAQPPDAYAIMKKVDERYTGDTRSSESQLILIDKNDRQRIRDLSMFALEKDGVEKSLIFFRSPSEVKGTAYMSFDWDDESKEDDSWLYLPALKQIKRIAASDESGAFMGSDFSYADINGLELNDFTYTLEKESEVVDGHDCWVITSTPKNDEVIDSTGYTSARSWIRKDIYIGVKGIINVKKGHKVKYFAIKDLENIDEIWTPHTLQMVTTRDGKREHSSLLKIGNMQYNKGVEESMFSTDAMQRGL